MDDFAATERQTLITVQGIPDYFSTFSGGETSAAVSDVWDGGKKEAEKQSGPPTTSNVVVTRPFRPARDQAIVKALDKVTGRWRTTVSRQWTDADLVTVGDPDVYALALLVAVRRPPGDAASSTTGMMELEFAVSTAA